MAESNKNKKKKTTKKTNNKKKTTNGNVKKLEKKQENNNSVKEEVIAKQILSERQKKQEDEEQKIIEALTSDEVEVEHIDKSKNKVEIKDNNKYVDRNNKSAFWSNEEAVRLLKIFCVILGLFILVYLVIATVRGDFKKEEETVVSTIQDTEILYGNVFDKKDEEYYVMMYDFESDEKDLYNTMVASFEGVTGNVVYTLDLSKKFNKDIVSKEENKLDVDDSSKLRVKDVVLLQIKDGKYKNSYVGKKKIKKFILEKIEEETKSEEE